MVVSYEQKTVCPMISSYFMTSYSLFCSPWTTCTTVEYKSVGCMLPSRGPGLAGNLCVNTRRHLDRFPQGSAWAGYRGLMKREREIRQREQSARAIRACRSVKRNNQKVTERSHLVTRYPDVNVNCIYFNTVNWMLTLFACYRTLRTLDRLLLTTCSVTLNTVVSSR